MSLDDSTAPEARPTPTPAPTRPLRARRQRAAAGRPRPPARRRRDRVRRPHRGGDEESEAADCVSEEVTLTTAPVMETSSRRPSTPSRPTSRASSVEVTTGTVKDVVAALGDPNAEMPEIWIPDSPTWKGQLDRCRLDRDGARRRRRADPRGPGQRPRREGARRVERRARGRQAGDGGPERRRCLGPGAAGALRRDEADRRDPPVHRGEDRPGRPDLRRACRGGRGYDDRPVHDHRDEHPAGPGRPSRPTSRPVAATTSSTWWRPAPAYRCSSSRSSTSTGAASDIWAPARDISARVGRALTRWFASEAGRRGRPAAELRGPDGAALAGGIGLGDAKVLSKVARRRPTTRCASGACCRFPPASWRWSTCPAR